MRISDWSSDVCSSDLPRNHPRNHNRTHLHPLRHPHRPPQIHRSRRRPITKTRSQLDPVPILRPPTEPNTERDRKRVVAGKSVSVRVDLGGRRINKKNTKTTNSTKRTTQTPTGP